jgi:hypothetical protein
VELTEFFSVVDAGQSRWVIKHTITDEVAGTVMLTSQGFVLRDENSRFIGAFPSIPVALRNLYATV